MDGWFQGVLRWMVGRWSLCLAPDGSHMRLIRFGMAFIDRSHGIYSG